MPLDILLDLEIVESKVEAAFQRKDKIKKRAHIDQILNF